MANGYSSSHAVSSSKIDSLPDLILGDYQLNTNSNLIKYALTQLSPNSAIFYW